MKLVNYGKLVGGVKYIPEFNDNRDLPEEEKVVFTLKPLTNGLKKKYKKLTKTEFVGKKNRQELVSNVEDVQEKIFKESVLSVENLAIENPATGDVERNPNADLIWEAAPTELIEELLDAINNTSVLEEGLKKH